MADDVQSITGTDAPAAMRLCNFGTAEADLLPSHIAALDEVVEPVIATMAGPWVDLFGYASRVGAPEFNRQLSRRRLDAVRDRIATYADNVNFQSQTAYGASQSLGEPDDNDGYWRAVDVYVYASRPTPPSPVPAAPQGSTNFEIRIAGGGTASPGILSADDYLFQIVDLTQTQTAFFLYTGGGVSLSLPKFPSPGSMTYAGPPAAFTTTLPVELYQFNCTATLFQDAGVSIGQLNVGGTLHLSIDEIKDTAGRLVATLPSDIPITSRGFSMPGLGSATHGVLALVSETFPFTGY